MSKFVDQLKRLSQVATEPIGFLPRLPSLPKPKIQLLAVVAPENLDGVADFTAGADAVLVPVARQSPSVKRLAALAESLPGIPWGGWLTGGHAGVSELVKAGCDFIVFPASSTPLNIVGESEPGKILEVEALLAEGLLRTVNDLPVDAVFITDDLRKDDSLTWQHLMLFQRFSTLLTKPLIVPVPTNIGADETKALWEAGVDCVVVETEGMAPDRLKELRKTIDSMTFSLPRRPKKIEPVLPQVRCEPDQVVEDEEEE